MTETPQGTGDQNRPEQQQPNPAPSPQQSRQGGSDNPWHAPQTPASTQHTNNGAPPPASAAPPSAQPNAPQPGAYPPPAAPYYSNPSSAAPGTGGVGMPPGPPAEPSSGSGSEPRRSRSGMAVALLAIGALVGGLAGGGVVGLYSLNQSDSTASSESSSTEGITINNPDKVTSTTAVAAKAAPSVVTIATSSQREGGTGSGIILSEDGYVVTNTHVVTLDGHAADVKLQVRDSSGKLYSAKVVGTDPIVDLAVIKMEGASGLTPADFGDSDDLNVGDSAIAIGSPLGLSGTVTDGIISALNRSINVASSAAPKGDQNETPRDDPFNQWFFDLPGRDEQQQTGNEMISLPVIQTDAAINPGNSGGALLDAEGKVIGINVAIASASQSSSSTQTGNIGVGFAIPSDLAKRVAHEIIENGSASHGLLGARVMDAAADSSVDVSGALIDSVSSGGAAADAGLKAGDVVTKFNGHPISGATDLTAQVRYLAADSSASLTYVRQGKAHETTVTLGSLD